MTRARVFVTIRAPADLPLREGKIFIQRKLGHLTQAFNRHQLVVLAITVYERKVGGHLHAHMLIYLQGRKACDLVETWADIFEQRPTGHRHDVTIHARPARATDAAYITKQREGFSEDCEANIRHQRQPGDYIPGNRWTQTPALKALNLEGPEVRNRADLAPIEWVEPFDPAEWLNGLPEQHQPLRPRVPIKREKLIVLKQLALPMDTQPDVIDIMTGLGLTDAEIGQHSGLSRPQVTNIRNRQYGASRHAVRRILELARAA